MIYIILTLGLILRLVSLNQSLWLDEATSALVAKMSVGDIFSHFLPGDFHPPLYYLVLKYWTTIFGYSEISLRMPSVIFGIATIYVIYLVAKKLFNQKTAFVASSLVATSGLAVYYSQEARMYDLATLLVGCLVYLFLEKKWIYFSMVLLLVGMTDYVSLFVVPIFLIVGRKDIKKVALSLIPLILAFIFWSPIFFRQLTGGFSIKGSAWWNILGQASFKNALLIPVKFIFGRVSFDNKAMYVVVAGTGICIFGYLLVKARYAGKVLWLWLIFPIVLGILASFKIPTLSYFRFLFCLPAFYMLVAAGVEKIGKHKNAFIVLVLIVNLLSSGYYLLNPKFHREDWRAAAAALGPDKIVFPADSQKEALIYYGKGSQIVDVLSLESTNREVWLSRYVWEIVDPNDATRHKIEGLGYNKASEYNFNGVLLWKYTKNLFASKQTMK